MSKPNAVTRIVLLPPGVMSYPHFTKARRYKEKGVEKGDPHFTCDFVFDPEDLKTVRYLDADANDGQGEIKEASLSAILTKMCLEAWPDEFTGVEDIKSAIKFKGLKWPLKDGNEIAEEQPAHADVFAGKKVVGTKTGEKYPPSLRCIKNGKRVILQPEVEADASMINRVFKGGNWSDVEVNIKTVEVDGKKFLTFYLNSVCFIKTGKSLGRGQSIMDTVGVQGGVSDHDPTEGLSEEIDADVDI